MVNRIAEKKKLQEMYLEEAVTLGDVSEAYEEYRKLKNNPNASEEDIKKAKGHMYYLSRKYRQYRESLGKKEETPVEQKIDQVLKEDVMVSLNEKKWEDLSKMSEAEKREQLEFLRKEMKTANEDKYPSMVYASFEKRMQDLEGSLNESGSASLQLCEDLENLEEDFIEEYFDNLEIEETSLIESYEYSKYVRGHIKNVKTGYRWLKRYMPELFPKGFFDPQNRAIRKTIRKHDKTKWGKDEYNAYDAYDDYRHGKKSKDDPEFAEVKANYDRAWNHHQKSNPHHWQYWVMTHGDGSTKVLDMPYENIIEMICDWWTFSWKENDLTAIFKWYNENKNSMILSPKTRSKVEEILSKMKRKIQELEKEEKKDLKEEAVMNVFNEKEDFDYCYGIPSQKKYPLYDEKHVKSAIRLFGHVDPRFERDLALAIIAKMRKYGLSYDLVGESNKLRRYLPKSAAQLTEDVINEEEIDDEDIEIIEMCALYEELSDLNNCKLVTEGAVLDGLKKAGSWIADKATKAGGAIKSFGKKAIAAVGGPVPAAVIGGSTLALGAAAAAVHHAKKKKKKAVLSENVIEVLDTLDENVLSMLSDQELVESYRDGRHRDYWTCPKCGANLDYGEKCDCDKEEQPKKDENEKKPLTEAVTFVDNAGKVKTTSVEDYVKSMHKYDIDTQIPFYKKDRNKMYKLLTEDGHLSGDMSVEDIAKKHGVSVEELEKQVKMGIEVEHEHTSDDEEAKRIALDHLFEFPDYYTRLDKMEEEGEESLKEAIKDWKEMSDEEQKTTKENGSLFKLNGELHVISPDGHAVPVFDKKKKPLKESVLDPVQRERCKEIFDSNDVMLEKVKKQIVDPFMKWKNNLDVKFTIDGIYLIGSSSGFQYTPASDVDITILSHDYNDGLWEKIKDTFPNGNILEGTEHPVNYFIRPKMDERGAENIYDILNGKWLKKAEKAHIDIHSPYIVEVARFFMNAFDLSLKEFERDKQDYLQIKELDPEKVEISEEEKADALSAKLVELKADLDSLRMGNHVLRSFLHEAYEKEDGIFEIHIEIKAKDDPRYSMNNLVYKLLEKYGYREKIDFTIKDAEDFLKREEALN